MHVVGREQGTSSPGKPEHPVLLFLQFYIRRKENSQPLLTGSSMPSFIPSCPIYLFLKTGSSFWVGTTPELGFWRVKKAQLKAERGSDAP